MRPSSELQINIKDPIIDAIEDELQLVN